MRHDIVLAPGLFSYYPFPGRTSWERLRPQPRDLPGQVHDTFLGRQGASIGRGKSHGYPYQDGGEEQAYLHGL